MKLQDICEKATSNIAQKDISDRNGIYPIYGASGFIKNINSFAIDTPYIGIVKDGAGVGRVMLLPAESSVIGTMQYILPKKGIDVAYLRYLLESMDLSKYSTGATIPHIYFKDYGNEQVKEYSEKEQKRIADELDKVSGLIEKRQKQLEKLDLLIKSRFVEMFGDPLKNEKKWEKAKLKDICNKIGDGLHGTPNYDDKGEYYFINGNNLENGEIRIYKETKKVNRSEFEKHKIDLSVNSILLSINGTLGKLAYYREEPVVLGKSVCFLDIKGNYNKIFAYHIMRSESFQQYINQNSTQSTIRNVGLKDLREITIINPQLQIQNQFADFVEKVEQNKSKIKNSLDKLITLKKALMQKYFG